MEYDTKIPYQCSRDSVFVKMLDFLLPEEEASPSCIIVIKFRLNRPENAIYSVKVYFFHHFREVSQRYSWVDSASVGTYAGRRRSIRVQTVSRHHLYL